MLVMRWLYCFTVACTLVLVHPSHAAKFVANTAAKLSSQQRLFIDQVWKPDLALTDHLIRQGHKHELEGRNWARLTHKLQKEGSTVTLVAFGGSVTVSLTWIAEN